MHGWFRVVIAFSSSDLDLPFKSMAQAETARKALAVDKELRPETVQKSFRVEDNHLLVYVSFFRIISELMPMSLQSTIKGSQRKYLKIGVSSFCDMAGVVVDTLREFDHPDP